MRSPRPSLGSRRAFALVLATASTFAGLTFTGSAAAEDCAGDGDCGEGQTCSEGVCQKRFGQEEMTERLEVSPELADRYVLETRSYPILFYVGAPLFGAAWIGTAVAAALTAKEGKTAAAAGAGAVPLAGPVLLHEKDQLEPTGEALVIVLGALQGVGLIASFVGLTMESEVLTPIGEVGLVVTPMAGRGTGGVMVGGTF